MILPRLLRQASQVERAFTPQVIEVEQAFTPKVVKVEQAFTPASPAGNLGGFSP